VRLTPSGPALPPPTLDERHMANMSPDTTPPPVRRPKPMPNTCKIILLATSKGRKAIRPPASGSRVR
jgi:hypothetical protein